MVGSGSGTGPVAGDLADPGQGVLGDGLCTMLSDLESGLNVEPADLRKSLGKAVVVSPHLDDAVLSCADLLVRNPGTLVVTVFAGAPDESQPLTDWDRLCGFATTAEAVALRKEEDAAALFLLEAMPRWLDFLDAQYGPRPALARVAEALAQAIGEHAPDAVLFPLGLFHSDHRLASDACLELCAGRSERHWIAYADALYRAIPGLQDERMSDLRRRGFSLQPLQGPTPTASKRQAARCYASQWRALDAPGHVPIEKAFEPEQYWQIERSG